MWNKQRREETLLDIEDVAPGHETKMRWNEAGLWVWSAEQVHEPLIDPETSKRAQQLLAARGRRPLNRKPRRTSHSYLLAGLVRCGICNRRMQGHWIHGRAQYRCRFLTEYALANGVDHPKSLYLREDAIIEPLDT